MPTPSHESPTQELSWFSLVEHQPRHEDARVGFSEPSEDAPHHGDVVDTDDVSKRTAGKSHHRRPGRTRFQLHGH